MNFYSTLSNPICFKEKRRMQAFQKGYVFMYPDHNGDMVKCIVLGVELYRDGYIYKCESSSTVVIMDCNWVERLSNIFYINENELARLPTE